MAKKVLVVIDPGHVGPKYNSGAVSGYYESMAMWKLSQYEKDELEKYGVKVILTKDNISDDVPLYDRGKVAVRNAKGYDVVVFESNHTNAFNGKAYGVTVIRSEHLPDSADLGDKIADAVVDTMHPETGLTYNRGVTTKTQSNGADWYGVIRGAVIGVKSETEAKKGPVKYAFIVEHGFHDNLKECRFLSEDDNLKKIAQAKAKIIADYFDLQANGSTSSPEKPLYRVRKTWLDAASQKGAFKNLDGAKRKADEFPGYSVYLDGTKLYTSKVPTISRRSKYTEGLQLALNASYGTSLVIDRSAGPLTQGVIDKHYLYYRWPTIKNAHVSWLQDALKELGYTIVVDGSYGPTTEAVVKQFQRDHGLKVDGIAGVKTHMMILSLL